MNKHTIVFIILLILLGIMSVRNAKAEAPLTDISVPLSIQQNPIKKFAYNQVKLTWDESQWESFNNIIEKESQWNPTAKNLKSSAYGLGQFLDSTWGTYEKTSDPQIQIIATIDYISKRYGDPTKAWVSWQKNHWY